MTQARPLLAAVWMIGAIVSFTSMAVSGRALITVHDTFEIMFFRSLIGVVLVMLVAGATGHLKDVTAHRFPVHVARNICHFTGQNLWFFSLGFIPLAHVFALEFTAPLWVMLLAALFLGERLTRIKGIAAVLAFVGVLLVVRPNIQSLNPGHITAALSAIGFAFTAIFTKRLTRDESITSILFWLTVIQSVLGAVAVFWDAQVQWPTAETIPWLFLVGCAGLVAHFCLTKALSLAPASVVMPIDFARLPVVALIGFFFYSEALEGIVILGAALILVANWLNVRGAMRR